MSLCGMKTKEVAIAGYTVVVTELNGEKTITIKGFDGTLGEFIEAYGDEILKL